jgi:hypothetical protein
MTTIALLLLLSGAQPPESAREVLALYGIGPAEFDQFRDDAPLAGGEIEVLGKILLRFSRLDSENIRRWTKRDLDWQDLAASAASHRGELCAIRGRARQLTEHKLPAALAERLGFAIYYRVVVAIEGSPQEAVICARQVPRAWQSGEVHDEPVIVDALLLKRGEVNKGAAPLVFAAQRVAWLPDREQSERGIGPSQLALARLGFDLGLLDAVRNTNGRGLTDSDREAFYQLLAAAGRIDAAEWEATTKLDMAKLDVVPLVENPQDHHGRWFRVAGTARRIIKVNVRDPATRERLGLAHYYEIDLFVPLGERKIRIGDPEKGEQSAVFESTFPVTLVARQLPAGLDEGESLHVPIEAQAFFFKTWTYPSAYMAERNLLQPAPLLVANEPSLVPPLARSNWVSSRLVTACLALTLAIVVVAVWWQWRDRRRSRPGAIL